MTDREKMIELLRDVQYLGGLEEKIADHLLANGVTIGKKERFLFTKRGDVIPLDRRWIPVTERLPEVRTPVLTYGRKGAVGIGFVQPTSKAADGKVYFYPRYGDNLPTHWMHLPEPPKGDSI